MYDTCMIHDANNNTVVKNSFTTQSVSCNIQYAQYLKFS